MSKDIDFDGICAFCFKAEYSFGDYLHDVTLSRNVNQLGALRVVLQNFRNATKKIYKEIKKYEEKNKTK